MWVKGKHSLIFGAQFQALQDNENFALVAAFTFANTQTAGYNAAGTLQASQGNAYASYLLGALSSSAINQNAIGETGGRYKDWAAYVQDDWKVSSRLTLNLGLRWDYMAVLRSEQPDVLLQPEPGQCGCGWPSGRAGVCGQRPDSCNCRTPVPSHNKNFGPRVGAAYRLDDKTVLRAGYSLMYVHAGGVGGRNNSRQGVSQLGYTATNNATSPEQRSGVLLG